MRNRDDRSDLAQNCLSHSPCRCNIGAHARQKQLPASRSAIHVSLQISSTSTPLSAKAREGLCLPAGVFRVSSRLFADRRLSPFTNPWPPAPRPCSSGRSGLFGPPLCGGSAPATPPLLHPPPQPVCGNMTLTTRCDPTSPDPASWLVPNLLQPRQAIAQPGPTHTPPIPRRGTPRMRPGPHPHIAPNLPRSP